MPDQRGSTIKQSLFEQFARTGKALASGRRLEMLEFLAQRERTVEDLARLCGLSVANASQHLRILRGAGLIETRKMGLHVYSRLAGRDVFDLYRALRRAAELRLAEIGRLANAYRSKRGSMEAVSLKELRRRMREGSVILLDVRPADEYADGHIPGARNLPLSELRSAIGGLPEGIEIVAYCRGPYCLLSDEAVAILHKSGRRGVRLAQGFPDWKAMGWRVQTARKESATA